MEREICKWFSPAVMSYVKLYALLFWFTLILAPLSSGLYVWTVVPILLLWFAALQMKRLSLRRRWMAWGMTASALACFAPMFYEWWHMQVGCPHCFAAEWHYLALDKADVAPWILWSGVAGSLAGGLLLPHPRWRWMSNGDGEFSLFPLLIIGLVFVFPMLMAALWGWSFFPSAPHGG